MPQTIPSKQPAEAWYIPFDFSTVLGSVNNPSAPEDVGEILEVLAEDVATGDDATADVTDLALSQINGKIAYVWVFGGEDGYRYKITCRIKAATSQQIFENDCIMPVREI